MVTCQEEQYDHALKEYLHTHFTCSSLSSINTKNKNANIKMKSKTLPKYSIKEKKIKIRNSCTVTRN